MLIGKSLMMLGPSVCHNPLEPPANLWTVGTEGRWFVLSVHCVKFLSAVSLVSLSL